MKESFKISPGQALSLLTCDFGQIISQMGISKIDPGQVSALSSWAKSSLRERDYGAALKSGTLAGRLFFAAEVDEKADKSELARRLVSAEMAFASAAKAAEELNTSDIQVNGNFGPIIILEKFRQAQIRYALKKTHALSIPYAPLALELCTRCNDFHHRDLYMKKDAPSIAKLERVVANAGLNLTPAQTEGFFRDSSIVLLQAYKGAKDYSKK